MFLTKQNSLQDFRLVRLAVHIAMNFRVEILESQLTTYGKSMTEDKLREETKRLMEEKESYQKTAKDTLKKLVDEKLEAMKRLKDVENSLGNSEDEYASLQQLYDRTVEENRKLSEKVTSLNDELAKKQKSLEEGQLEALNETDIKKESFYIENSTDSLLSESLTENGTNSSGMNGKLCDKEGQVDRISQEMAGSTDSLDGRTFVFPNHSNQSIFKYLSRVS